MTTQYITLKLTLREACMLAAFADNVLGGDEQDIAAVLGEQPRNYKAGDTAGSKLRTAIFNADPTMGAQFLDTDNSRK